MCPSRKVPSCSHHAPSTHSARAARRTGLEAAWASSTIERSNQARSSREQMCIAATCTAGVRVGVRVRVRVRVRMRARIRVKASVEGSVRVRVGCVHGGRLLRWRQREVLGVETDEPH